MTRRQHRALPIALPLLGMLAVSFDAAAQQPWPSELARPTAPAQQTAPAIENEDELSPRQIQPAPDAPSNLQSDTAAPQARRPRARAANSSAATPANPPAARTTAAGRPTGRTIACNGVFGRDSNHLRLAMAFEARNVAFTQVDGTDGKLNASVVFPNDPKRRLEVVWDNEAARSGTSVIAIGGQSQWQAPRGIRLGMALAALEKANGRPFKLAGLDQPNAGSVLDWNGGAIDSLPGGCKVGVRLSADPKTDDAARAAAAGKEMMSSDVTLKAAKLGIVEILVGY